MYIWNYFKVKNYLKSHLIHGFLIKGVPGPPRGAIRRSSGNHCSHPTSSFPGEGSERRWGRPKDGSFSKSGACSTASSVLVQGLTDQERGKRGGGSRDGLAAHTLLHSDTPGKPCVWGGGDAAQGLRFERGRKASCSDLKTNKLTNKKPKQLSCCGGSVTQWLGAWVLEAANMSSYSCSISYSVTLGKSLPPSDCLPQAVIMTETARAEVKRMASGARSSGSNLTLTTHSLCDLRQHIQPLCASVSSHVCWQQ